MKIEIIDQSGYQRDQWAHGSSVQLYIFPPNANYKEREFSWRVSSASVESPASEFTVLYGVKRWIMPFDFSMVLKHTQNEKPLYSITLKPYETHCFKGDWVTKSEGMGHDFNLMLKEGADGLLKPLNIVKQNEARLREVFHEAFDERLPILESRMTLGLISRHDDFLIETGDGEIRVPKKDLALIHYRIEDLDLVRNIRLKAGNDERQMVVMFVVTYEEDESTCRCD
ncbi:MAG: HutD family protein [Bacillota bacterium]|nr:HutD family protein [Bacillota bacterium]